MKITEQLRIGGDRPKPVREKYVICTICDIHCQLRAEASDGVVTKIKQHDNPVFAKHICYKGTAAPNIHNHPDRLKMPLKRVGQRGEDRWEEISYEQAMDEIAERLQIVIDTHGPEAFAVSTSGWNTSTNYGFDRRLMNLLGSPNWTSGVALCAGNTAAVNKLTYGWFPFPDYQNTKCIVLFGHNPRKHSWTPIYHMIEDAKKRGAKVIVLDPRVSDQAETADIHLSLRAGTDAAMCLGWLKVIFDEELYDKDFVANWTVGFDELRCRVDEYPLERVSEITDVPVELIQEAARMYATADSAVIPWTPITDMQVSSTSAIRLHSILRAVTGNLDTLGGDTLGGFSEHIIPESELQLGHVLSQAQRDKQLGSDKHPAYTFRAQDLLAPHTERVWGHAHTDLIMGCYMANPSAMFRAMATEAPYPVKAYFALGNNALMSYANQHQIHAGIMNQDLVVVHDIFMTPTAMLADYVLPGDVFTERNHLSDAWGWVNRLMLSEKVVEPPPEASSTFEFWTGLARRLGFGEHFEWDTLEDLHDYRLAPSGQTFEEFRETSHMVFGVPEYRKYERTGFATPSGKVELSSSILAQLGFDPLPYYREGPTVSEDLPYRVFTGVREDPFFQTGQRQVGALRRRQPAPRLFVHPIDAETEGLSEGDWAALETSTGRVVAEISIHDTMKQGHVRVPHGWWYPELRGTEQLGGSFISSDAVLCPDDDEDLDHEQGIPHFKGFPGRLVKLDGRPAELDQSFAAVAERDA